MGGKPEGGSMFVEFKGWEVEREEMGGRRLLWSEK